MTAMYIALEGPDGVGKSTVAAALKELLLHRENAPYACVRIRHFPTDVLVDEARRTHHLLRAEDYMLDMENWLAFRPGPVLFPDEPPAGPGAGAGAVYILDRWVLSTLVYASLRGERLGGGAMTTAAWLQQIPLGTFVLLPTEPEELVDPDYGADNMTTEGYDPAATTAAYRRALAGAFANGFVSTYSPVEVDRMKDTPLSIAERIAEHVEFYLRMRAAAL